MYGNFAEQSEDMIFDDRKVFSGLFPISRQNSCKLPVTFSRQNSLQVQEKQLNNWRTESKGTEQQVQLEDDDELIDQIINELVGPHVHTTGNVEIWSLNDDGTAFSGLFPISRQNSCKPPVTFSRQNSLQVQEKQLNNCYCGGASCEQRYMRQSRHPRIIEPCSKLWKDGFEKKVQIRIPKELQSHIGYGSCKHCYKALVTLVTHIQVQCGFRTRPDVIQTFCPPTERDIAHARWVIQGFGLPVIFYINTWAPSFQERFVTTCGGMQCVQTAMRQFFTPSSEPDEDDDFLETEWAMLADEPKLSQNKSESYIERIRTILTNTSNTSVHKLSMCNAVLYECLSVADALK